jgi:small-conductance mechanosensitive channel
MIESLETTNYFQLLEPVFWIATAVVIGLLIEYVIMPWLRWFARKTHWPGDDLIIEALRGMSILWSVLIGIHLASLQVQMIPSLTLLVLQEFLLVIAVLSGTVVMFRLITGIVRISSGAMEISSVSILNNIIRVVVLLIGLLVVFQFLNISVTPLLTALAASGIGLGLALQDTLSNLFAGIWLVASNQIRPGHYVRLSTGEEGYVSDINWRTTNIKQLMNNMVIVPNSIMTTAIVINYYDPQKELSILIDLGVSYECDLEHVEQVTIEVAKEIMQEVEGGVADYEPFIRYNTFGDYRVGFTVILRGKEFVNQYLIKHEFVKRLHRRYRQEGIVIPMPVRTLQTPDASPLSVMQISSQNGPGSYEREEFNVSRQRKEEQ